MNPLASVYKRYFLSLSFSVLKFLILFCKELVYLNVSLKHILCVAEFFLTEDKNCFVNFYGGVLKVWKYF